MNPDERKFALEIENLTVSYGDRTVLRNVTMALPAGISCSIIGPNGAGKSTMLNSLLGLIHRDTGSVKILGKEFTPRDGLLAYIPQKEQIDWDFPVRVIDVVMMGRSAGLGWFGRQKVGDRQICIDSLKQVGMEDFADRHIRLLSGGQQQRVFIARALAQRAQVLIMDEPFAGVDVNTEKTILKLMHELCDDGKTVIIVNHNLDILDRFDWIIMINGALIAIGPTKSTYSVENRKLTYGPTLTEIAEAEAILESGVAK